MIILFIKLFFLLTSNLLTLDISFDSKVFTLDTNSAACNPESLATKSISFDSTAFLFVCSCLIELWLVLCSGPLWWNYQLLVWRKKYMMFNFCIVLCFFLVGDFVPTLNITIRITILWVHFVLLLTFNLFHNNYSW